jgi:hypothetical protein
LKTLSEVKLRNLQEMLMLAHAHNKLDLIEKYKAEIAKMREIVEQEKANLDICVDNKSI